MPKNKKLVSLIKILFFIFILLFCGFVYSLYAASDRKVVLNGSKHMTIEVNEPFIDPGATSVDGRPIKEYGSVDTSKIGTYTLTYKTGSFLWSAVAKREVVVIDSAPPEITLNYTEGYAVNSPDQYKEEGYSAIDNYDGDITDKVEISKNGSRIQYSVTDSSGNTAIVYRELPIKDTTPPEITLKGESEMTIDAGSEYIEQGATAYDNKDNDVTDSLQIDGAVNIYSAGTYPITYTACDKSGNASSVTRTVVVKETDNEAQGKTIYLTFDDGPGEYTEKLLDILDKYGVKATFFVTNQNPDYNYVIREIAERGHSIGIHTYSHDYKDIYSSVSAYFNDMDCMQQIVKEQAGFTTSLVRFPGGSSNTISKCYSLGIMTELASELNGRNMQYFDWNVSSGDAGEVCTTDAVYRNVINGISGKDTAVVLQHDIKWFSVEAVGRIIEWGIANGYTFSALHSGSPTAHHKIFN